MNRTEGSQTKDQRISPMMTQGSGHNSQSPLKEINWRKRKQSRDSASSNMNNSTKMRNSTQILNENQNGHLQSRPKHPSRRHNFSTSVLKPESLTENSQSLNNTATATPALGNTTAQTHSRTDNQGSFFNIREESGISEKKLRHSPSET